MNSYYVLRAQCREWDRRLPGNRVQQVYSQSRGELLFLLRSGGALQLILKPPMIAMFWRDRHMRRGRNVATLLPRADNRQIIGVHLAEGDRTITVATDGPLDMVFCLYGPRPNVYLADTDGVIADSFRQSASPRMPEPRPTSLPSTVEELKRRWQGATPERALRRACPLLDATLANEVIMRLGAREQHPAAMSDTQLEDVLALTHGLAEQLQAPRPRIYWKESGEGIVALTPMVSLSDLREELFDSVNDAVRVLALHTLTMRALSARRSAVAKVLDKSLLSALRTVENVRREQERPSRHEEYERLAHLLMACACTGPGRDNVEVDDLFAGGGRVAIPLDASLGTVANAERYYKKAGKARRARAHLQGRLDRAAGLSRVLQAAAEELLSVSSAAAMDAYEKRHAGLLRQTGPRTGFDIKRKFRRYDMGEGFELWVSRNRGEADRLTFRHARKFDIWLHARGCTGAHAVLRLPGRDATPGKAVIERAASIAAFHSKGRHSALVPVIVTPCKYVRKARGAAPGEVVVEREEVVVVPPED